MKNGFSCSRRQFAAQVASSAGFLALSLGSGKQARAAQGAIANADPRFLINIHTRGGCDTFWFHNYCRSADLDAYCAASGTVRSSLYSDRFPQSMAIQHPFNSAQYMGIGMSLFNKDDLSRMALWKGISPDGSHDIGNRIVNCGQFSNYAASFSSLISVALAERNPPLPLHYVQAAESAAALFTWPGLLTGYALAVNLPTRQSFTDITGQLPNELSTSRRTLVNSAVNAIAAATTSPGFRLKSSKAYYDTFLSSFQAMNQIYGSGIGASAQFSAVISAYQSAAIAALQQLDTSYHDVLGDAFADAGGLAQLADSTSVLSKQINEAAYAFALGEFLVTQGLSRVVDIGPMTLSHDGHTDNGKEFASLTIKYGMLRVLIRRMGDAGATGTVPGTQGRNFLQHTTIVMTTEFDRTAQVYQSVPGTAPGTNHGSTASVILAGRGVKGGTVFGDFKTAPGANGLYSAHASRGFQAALPVNLTTGLPDPSGTLIGTKSIFNTMLAIFGVEVPAQQITGGVPFSPIIG